MVIGHDGQPRAASESVSGDPIFGSPSPHGFRHPVKFGIGTTLDVIMALNFQSDVVRPALRAFDKTVVESGHESCGIYTKNIFTAEFAETAEDNKKSSLVLSAISAFSAVNNLLQLVP